jgi:hypothetical protein
MLNTFIKKRGITQKLINNNNNNNKQLFNQFNLDVDYDGQKANISFTSDTDCNKNHFDIQLDNEDLANLLNIPSVSTPIEKRLQMDFNTPSFRRKPKFLQIVIPHIKTPNIQLRKQSYLVEHKLPLDEEKLHLLEDKLHLVEHKLPLDQEPKTHKESIQELLQSIKHNSYLSSPLPEEELIAPISIDNKAFNNYTLTPHKRHKRPKTHKTYKVYKKPKSSYTIKGAGIKKSKSKSRTSKLYTLF